MTEYGHVRKGRLVRWFCYMFGHRWERRPDGSRGLCQRCWYSVVRDGPDDEWRRVQ